MELADFKETIIELEADTEGKNIATLITSPHNTGNRNAVLYVHGFVDYFFHPHVAEAFHEQDMDFYALDLRKYGRALLPHQSPNFCTSLEDYFPEISQAIATMQNQSAQKIYFLGHSTGCTILALYMNKGDKKSAVSGLILNSPFLELPQSKIETFALANIGKVLIKIKPKAITPSSLQSIYAKSLHKEFSGEWQFDLTKKPVDGFPIYFQWALGIIQAQKFLQKHSQITVPILVMHAERSSKSKKMTEDTFTTDIVLRVADIKKHGGKLGNQVTFLEVRDGMHDLFLSRKPVREQALTDMFTWLNSNDCTKINQ